ncbi:MAG: precorrin-8X methylmutase [Cyanobacteria bacterium P01_E01_bin.34]
MHPITAASFEAIDREIGPHSWTEREYAIVRRAIHSTADFDFNHLFRFSNGAIAAGIRAIQTGTPVVVDVHMVEAGVKTSLSRSRCPLYCAIAHAPNTDSYNETSGSHPVSPSPLGLTRTAAGMRALAIRYPNSVFVVGNAPTALLELVRSSEAQEIAPALIVGVPVGFISVKQAKSALADVRIPQIVVQGRKGGSPVAAAIVNALVELAQTRE